MPDVVEDGGLKRTPRSQTAVLIGDSGSACVVRSMGVPIESITMLGSRTDIVGRWSGATDPEIKMQKLQWMDRVLRTLGVDY